MTAQRLAQFVAIALCHTSLLSFGEMMTNNRSNNGTCGLFMAISTIPNAGIGVFTAVPLRKGENVGYPDLAIPVTDIDWHNAGSRQKRDYHWLWSNYDWLATEIGDLEHEAEDAQACIPGMGAMPNCHFRLSNVKESWTRYDTLGLQRLKSPGAGAFTGYHGRQSTALKDLEEGSEIFVNYGEHWFTMRENELGLVPIAQSYTEAELILKKFYALLSTIGKSGDHDLKNDLWDIMKKFPYKSRALSALPQFSETADRAIEVGIKETELEGSVRSVEWLKKNGKCLDNLRPGTSTIKDAGRGAFATRFLPKGKIVAPGPLIHIPYKDSLLMYGALKDQVNENGYTIRNTSDIIGKQLLLNYCFGHSQSTLLLCPYGSGTAYINHNQNSPNVEILWSNASQAMIHNATWLSMSIDFLDDQFFPGLEFDYVAIKDIHPGDEVFIDYGIEWDMAFKHHIKHWTPTENAKNYEDVSQLNCFDDESCSSTPSIRTEDEQEKQPYSGQLTIYCYFNYSDERDPIWSDELDDWRIHHGNDFVSKYPCSIIKRNTAQNGSRVYTVELFIPFLTDGHSEVTEENDYENLVFEGVPQYGIQFVSDRYSSDLFLPNSFRHEMMIPESIMPEVWKNLL